MNRIVSFALFAFVVAAAAFSVNAQENIIKNDHFTGIIVTHQQAWDYLVKPRDFWIPTKAEVLAAEKKIRKSFESAKPEYHLRQKLDGYARQYVGITVDGQRRIYCYFYCRGIEDKLSEEPLLIADGGDCVFTIEYNPKNHQLSEFRPNGYA